MSNEDSSDRQNLTQERSEIAKQLKNARISDRKGDYTVNRSGSDCILNLYGLQNLFEYIRSLGSSNTILDIGAGTTRAAYHLSKSEIGLGLDFLATVLRRDPRIRDFLGYSKVTSTSAEILRGIPASSVGGIISDKAIMYTVSPELVVKRLDEVLVPGGVIKFSLGGGFNTKYGEDFIPFLEALGYDYAFKSRKLYGGSFESKHDVVLAIKPGGSHDVTAEELMQADYESYSTQMEQVNEEPHREDDPKWLQEALRNHSSGVEITYTDFDKVYKALALAEGAITSTSTVLALGEGLSDFADALHNRTGGRVLSIDPIYQLGSSVLQGDPKHLKAEMYRRYGTRVKIGSYGTTHEQIPIKNKSMMMAGVASQLPFLDKQFELILAYDLFRYLDLGESLPEIYRVLRDDGEVRFGAVKFTLNMDGQELLPGFEQKQRLIDETQDPDAFWWNVNRGLITAFNWAKTHKISVYVLPQNASYQKCQYSGGLLIFRKDDQTPRFSYSAPDKKDHPDLGTLLRVDTTQLILDSREYPKMDRTFQLDSRRRGFMNEEAPIMSFKVEKVEMV